ncbi:hypothetical protein ACWJVA_25200, partial [Escherichia coli]
SLIKQVLRAYIFCGACGNNRTNRGGFQFAAARLPWFTEIKKDGKVYFQIHKRDPDLNLNNTQPPLEVVEDEEENSGSSVLEGELCPPADPIDGDDVLTVHDLTAEELRYIRSLRSQKKNSNAS